MAGQQPPPTSLELIGDQLALAWPDGREDFLSGPFLRERSPSAENMGEPDLFGNWSGGDALRDRSEVSLKGFQYVGNYAVRILFSDGHDTGIYSWDYLRKIAGEVEKS